MNVVENGTSVQEEVEVDVDEQTEVIRVPQHNDVDALELMNDYNSVIYESIHSQLCLNNYDLIHLALTCF